MIWRAMRAAAEKRLGHARRSDIDLLMAYVRHMPRANLLAHLDEDASLEEAATFEGYVVRLADHEPLQYILGEAPFWDMTLAVDPSVLIPRFDTEVLVTEALSLMADMPSPKVLDLCTGSGAVALALARERTDAIVFASDISLKALQMAEKNAKKYAPDIHFRHGDLFEPWGEMPFYLIVANPPYIKETERASLMPEVALFEPALALYAGEDGLAIYRRLIEAATNHLEQKGWLAVEIGCSQAQEVVTLFRCAGFTDVRVREDGQGLDRVVSGKWLM